MLVDGLVHQFKSTPAEYLIRMRLVAKHFGFAPTPIGMTDAGQIVTRQKFIVGEPATQAEVDEFLESAGLEAVKRHCWLWKITEPKIEEWVGDARCDNFVRTATGVVPIDLRMWRTLI